MYGKKASIHILHSFIIICLKLTLIVLDTTKNKIVLLYILYYFFCFSHLRQMFQTLQPFHRIYDLQLFHRDRLHDFLLDLWIFINTNLRNDIFFLGKWRWCFEWPLFFKWWQTTSFHFAFTSHSKFHTESFCTTFNSGWSFFASAYVNDQIVSVKDQHFSHLHIFWTVPNWIVRFVHIGWTDRH